MNFDVTKADHASADSCDFDVMMSTDIVFKVGIIVAVQIRDDGSKQYHIGWSSFL